MSTHAVTIAVSGTLRVMSSVRAVEAAAGESSEIRTLVARARAGDRPAFEELVVMNERVAVRAAMAALGRREDADEVVQDAFVLAWTHVATFRGDSAFRTWLLSIVWRRALDYRRRRNGWFRWTGSHPEALDRAVTDTPDPERRAVASDLARHVADEISRLSPTLKDTLLLAASGDYSYEEISQMLGAPVGTIKWRVSEARRLVSAAVGHSRRG